MCENPKFRWLRKVWYKDSRGKYLPVQIVGLHYHSDGTADGLAMLALSDQGFNSRNTLPVKGAISWIEYRHIDSHLFAEKPRETCECCGQLLPEEVIP